MFGDRLQVIRPTQQAHLPMKAAVAGCRIIFVTMTLQSAVTFQHLVVHLSCASSVLHSQKAPPNIKRKVEGRKRTQQITSAKLLGKKGGCGPMHSVALFLQGFSPHKLKVTWEGRRHSRQLPGATETELYCQLPLSSGHRLYKTKGHAVVSA